MLTGTVRRVAIVGGVRIPFARAMGAYADCSNQDMLTAALKGVVVPTCQIAVGFLAHVLSSNAPCRFMISHCWAMVSRLFHVQ